MHFETKLAIAIRDDLLPWQGLNVTAFLAGGLAGNHPGMIGEPYLDASGQRYSSLIREPVFVFVATAETLQRTRSRAVSRDVAASIYTMDMFSTDHDAANRAVVAGAAPDALDLVGVAVYGERKPVDKIINGLKRFP